MISIRYRLLLAVACCLALLQGLNADPLQEGVTAFRAGQYHEARRLLLPLAETGDANAHYFLSNIYGRGLGVAEDRSRAVEHLTKAAEGGHLVAQFNLGNHYNKGEWVEQDAHTAAYWWRLAAGQGLPQAQYNLGSLYFYGRGVEKDLEQARFWYQQAAEAGSELAERAVRSMGGPVSGRKVMAAPAAVPSSRPVPRPSPKPAAGSGPQPRKPSAEVARQPDFSALALGVDWVKSQSPDDFTLQLFATDNPETVQRYLSENRFARQVAVYPFRRNGVEWHGILYGRFNSAEQAKAARAELPAALGAAKPWARSFGQLQEIIAGSVDGH